MNKEEISKRIDEGLKILKQEPSFIFYPEELDKKDKVIDLMAEKYLSYCDFCNDFNDKNEVKQYFYKKVEEENDI